VYRLNGHTGGVRKPLTSGNWAVREILHVQEPKKTVFFVASGREQDQDPYNRHLYRVGFDGTRLKRLTPESGDHNISVSPTGRYFVDTYSRIDSPPITVLRAADGRLVRVLQRGDISRVVAAGWRVPEPFKAKAADGKTDIYGAIYRPSNFDPSRKYPVLDGIYPGPQVIQTPKAFEVPPAHKNHQAFAELGFIVVVVDGRGGPLRSRAFREASYGQMGSAGGLDDHIAALRQLANKYPQFDIDRVGIYGHSGGGYAAARALLLYPDFYKVAVASSGNHDLRSYSAHFIERFQGYPVDVAQYAAQSNPPLAHRLKGKLLLIHGDLDDNVHVSNTLQMADALIAARKDFDLLIMPNRNHAFADLAKGADGSSATDPYFIRRRWDFFVRHLLGVTPPAETQ
jgi:dipeptidyl aminopeptidase/acylaminoacyl peptidase